MPVGIELICQAGKQEINVGYDISWGFIVESVDEKICFLQQKGIAIQEGPVQPNPHVRFFYILDPNGLRIQFVENI